MEVIDISDGEESPRRFPEVIEITSEASRDPRDVSIYEIHSEVSYKQTQSSPSRVERKEPPRLCLSPTPNVQGGSHTHIPNLSPKAARLYPKAANLSPKAPTLSPAKDSIIDSSFSFNIPKSHNPVPSAILDLNNWLSESEEDSISKIIVASQNLRNEETTKSNEIQTKPLEESSPQKLHPVKKSVKRSIEANKSPQRKRKQNSLYTELSDPVSESSSPMKMNRQPQFTYTPKDLREANKVTRKKEELMNEMILKVSHQLHGHLQETRIKSTFVETAVETFPSRIPIIYWKRKVMARYNPDTDTFLPCPLHHIHEKTIVLYYKAEEFLERAQSNKLLADCEFSTSLLRKIDNKIEYKVIVMVEGYDQLMLKLKNTENLKYKNEVLKRLSNETIRTTKTKEPEISLKDLEYLFNKVQLDVGVNIFPIRNPVEGINWLHSFTYTIAYSLYDKFERNHTLANLGSVRSGTDTKSTYIQTLRQFKLMTEPKAERLFGQYSSLLAIYAELQKKGTLGKDGSGKNYVPPSADSAMKKTFLSESAESLINE